MVVVLGLSIVHCWRGREHLMVAVLGLPIVRCWRGREHRMVVVLGLPIVHFEVVAHVYVAVSLSMVL